MKYGFIAHPECSMDTILDKIDKILEDTNPADTFYVPLEYSENLQAISEKAMDKKVKVVGVYQEGTDISTLPMNRVDDVICVENVENFLLVNVNRHTEFLPDDFLSEDAPLLSEATTKKLSGSARRKAVEKLIYDVIGTLDPTGYNTNMYKEKFKKMSDAQFDTFFKKFLADEDENFYIEISQFKDSKHEPTLDTIEKAAKIIDVPLHEFIYLPYVNPNGKPVKTIEPVPVGYLHLKRLQQLLLKKNSSSNSTESRNAKTGQLVGADKNGRISDVENYALIAIDAEYALKEFMSARSDDSNMRQQMLKQINRDGYVQLKNLQSDIKYKQAINSLDVYFTGAHIMTDLLTPGLVLLKNVSKTTEVKQRTDTNFKK